MSARADRWQASMRAASRPPSNWKMAWDIFELVVSIGCLFVGMLAGFASDWDRGSFFLILAIITAGVRLTRNERA